MDIASRIKSLRSDRGLTQHALAAALGWERGTIATIETGKDRPGAELVTALADYFGTTTDYILGRTGLAEPAAAQTEEEAEVLRLFRSTKPEGRLAVVATLRAVTNSTQ